MLMCAVGCGIFLILAFMLTIWRSESQIVSGYHDANRHLADLERSLNARLTQTDSQIQLMNTQLGVIAQQIQHPGSPIPPPPAMLQPVQQPQQWQQPLQQQQQQQQQYPPPLNQQPAQPVQNQWVNPPPVPPAPPAIPQPQPQIPPGQANVAMPPLEGGVWRGQGLWPGAPKRSSILEDTEKLEAVRNAVRHAWTGYVRFAFGQDELKPVSNTGYNWLGMGATIVDGLDTLWILGLKDEFKQARDWVATSLNLNVNMGVSFFETIIRCLGGLLSAYELSSDRMFLDKARELGEKLLGAFRLPSGLPMATVNLATGAAEPPQWTSGGLILAEIGTFQMEFKALSRHTGDPKWDQKAQAVFDHLDRIAPADGLYPLFIDMNTGGFQGDQISFGAMGDSFYEYTIKMHVYTGKAVPQYRRMYDRSINGVMQKLIYDSTPTGFTYIAEMEGGNIVPKMDHLACFVPGMLALGADGAGKERDKHMRVARGLARTCYEMYNRQATKVAPEFINFVNGADFVNGANHNLLRPEALEAMFVMWRMTGDPIYREWGWTMFQGFENNCKTSSGYSGLQDVTRVPSPQDDAMQSFFLAETLKYAGLLFTDGETIPLDEYVLNTEAHPLKIFRQT